MDTLIASQLRRRTFSTGQPSRRSQFFGVPRSTPDISYPRAQRIIVPSWSGTQKYLTPEHEKISVLTKNIEGWLVEGDAYKLYEMGYHAGDVILEIGAYAGKSAVIEILGSRANPRRKRTRWFGLDLDPDAIPRTRRTLEQWNLSQHARLFNCDLRTFITRRSISPTMVFVDGDHSYAGVKNDIAVLSQYLASGVPILFHDYLNPKAEGVRRACDEWEQSGHAKFMGCFGCSALFLTLRGRPHHVFLWEKLKFFARRRLRRIRGG